MAFRTSLRAGTARLAPGSVRGGIVARGGVAPRAIAGRAVFRQALRPAAIITPTVQVDATSQMTSSISAGLITVSSGGDEIITATITRTPNTDLDMLVGWEVHTKIADSLAAQVDIKRDGSSLIQYTFAIPIYYMNGTTESHGGFMLVPYADQSEQHDDHTYSVDLRFYASGGYVAVDVENRSIRLWERKK